MLGLKHVFLFTHAEQVHPRQAAYLTPHRDVTRDPIH